ncbi:hypothetical protein FRC07_007847 [Ceratobasidium sp. 392]|nr:hypothetical protein FRC07_007847 [Ceratobasidium sp. 392]
MPTLAGWYLSLEVCRAWLKPHYPEIYDRNPRAGAGALQLAIGRALDEHGYSEQIDLQLVSPPGFKGTWEEMPGWCLMLVRRTSADKVYLPPDPDAYEFDAFAKSIIEKMFNLELPEWSVVWWDSADPEMLSEFLHPGMCYYCCRPLPTES